MRYFIICDDSGNPIYYDHPEGMMACLIFNGLDQFLTERDEHFSQKFKSMWCGGVLFVAQKYKNLSFLVVSDQGESEMYLRTLLRQIFEHMVMLFGLQVMLEGKYTSFTRHKKTLQHIIDTTCTLGDRHQALLVRATERLEVNDRTRGECFNALKNTVQNEKLITHALVFVGTKLLVSYSRGGKSQDIDPSDLLLIINDFHATFHPPNREVEEMELPIADYRDHSNITIRGAQIPRGVDGQVDAPSEPPAEDYDDDAAAASHTDAHSSPTRSEERTGTDHAEVEDEGGRIEQQAGETPQGTENGKGIHEIAQSAAATPGAPPAGEEEEAEEKERAAAEAHVEENKEELKAEEEEEAPVPRRRDGDGGALSPPPGHAGDVFGDDGKGETAVARETGTRAACDGAAAHTEDPRNAVRHDAGSANVPSDPSQQDHHDQQPRAPPPSTPTPSLGAGAGVGGTNEDVAGEPARSSSPEKDDHDHDPSQQDHQKQEADEPPHAHTRDEEASENTTTAFAAAAEEGGGADGTKEGRANEEAAEAGEEGDGEEEEEEEEFLLRNDEEYDPTKLTKYKALHLRTPRYAPFWVYYAELGRKTTLVVLTSNNPQTGAKGTPEERQELDRVRDTMRALLQSYSTYLITKEHTHLPILSFLHQFPGLVHFIFVDRTFNRVIAPSISALHAMDRPPDEEEERNMKRVIKRLVWDMCYDSQQHLSEGAQSVLVKSGPWQYSYRLWVEDVDGFELIFPPEVPFGTPHVPQTNKFYQKLMHRFFPTRGNLRCYELFTLYLSTLSVETVAHHDRELVSVLLNRTMK